MNVNDLNNTKRVLVTGGAGFVGMNICQKLLSKGWKVILCDLKLPEEKYIEELKEEKGELTVCRADIMDFFALKNIIKENKVTDIIHGAALTPGRKMEETEGEKIIEINCLGTLHILNAFIEEKVPGKFLMLGSISAYGKTALKNEPLVEGVSMADPGSFYEISKFAAERIFLRSKELFQIPGCVVRIGDVFGPWEHYSGVRAHMSLPYQAAALAVKGESAVLPRVYKGEWIYGPDLARAIYLLLLSETFSHNIYPLSSGERWTITEWCSLLQKKYPDFTFNIAKEAEHVNLKINQPADNAPMVSQNLSKDTGFKAEFGLEAAFWDYMNWMEKHPGYVV
ncbi:MAG: NAD(P)-dependent oxidoreductase [Lachnoclostridium edouardi]|uniref:NAD-dependent epimerase/dehydratase family protein n=1 Tax=Lachnoclostridium edouardi TaxID=1926283 RepID=UPI0026DD87F9|nr:NAD(P)-dependent oxidoreductase [Lachnoclostridium edouardi]MDO4279334.1 NAD(P)-dependent oxidoreductase [Lachnoclostridium edouardi]